MSFNNPSFRISCLDSCSLKSLDLLKPFSQDAIACVFSGTPDACGPDSVDGELAGRCVLTYVVFNLLWNMGILLSVKHTGALATFIALKAIFPATWQIFV